MVLFAQLVGSYFSGKRNALVEVVRPDADIALVVASFMPTEKGNPVVTFSVEIPVRTELCMQEWFQAVVDFPHAGLFEGVRQCKSMGVNKNRHGSLQSDKKRNQKNPEGIDSSLIEIMLLPLPSAIGMKAG
jgi:hypothetical protein